MRLSAAGLAGSAAHPPLRGRPQTRRRVRAVSSQSNIIERTSPRSGRTRNGTLARCDADGRCGGKQSDDQAVAPTALRRQSKRIRVRRPPGKERGKSASGSVQRLRTLKERSDRHTGAAILLWEREGKALGVPAQPMKWRRSASLSRNAALERHPCTARRRRAVWRQAER